MRLHYLGPANMHGRACFRPGREETHRSMNASAGVNSNPCASATGLLAILPSQTLSPFRKWMSSFKAWRQPMLARCKVKGRVALLSAKVDVRATAPGDHKGRIGM